MKRRIGGLLVALIISGCTCGLPPAAANALANASAEFHTIEIQNAEKCEREKNYLCAASFYDLLGAYSNTWRERFHYRRKAAQMRKMAVKR